MNDELAVIERTPFSLAEPPLHPVPPVPPIQEMRQIAELLAQSGYFKDVRDASQAFTKMLRGWELGIGYAASLCEIDIIQGKPVLSAALMARLVKSSGKYDYRVLVATAQECELEFFERG